MKASQMLAKLNELRIANSKPALKSWRDSNAKLAAAIAKLESAAPQTKAAAINETKTRASKLAAWALENGINPKIARARLRHAGVEKAADGHYELNARVRKIAAGE